MNNIRTIFNFQFSIFSKFSLKQLKKIFSLILLFAMVFTSYPHSTFAEGVQLIPRENNVLGAETAPSDRVKDDLESIESFLSHAENTDQSNIVAPDLGLFTLADRAVPNSAAFYIEAKFRTLSKKSYRAMEKVEVVVDNAKLEDLIVTVFDHDGNQVEVDKKILNSEFPAALEIDPPKNHFKPGRYRLLVRDSHGKISTQDFTWGVLAINPNKAVYLPSETAHFSIAVLDEVGMMVCDADVELKISAPELAIFQTLSTKDGTIKVNKECELKEYVEVPDYEAVFKIPEGGVGKYDVALSATTYEETYNGRNPKGTNSITSSFEVKESVKFDVERIAHTRIYPYEKYPMKINLTANEDFEGTIEEIVPGSFEIEPTVDVGPADEGSILGESTSEGSPSAQLSPAPETSSSASTKVITAQNQTDTSFTKIEEYLEFEALVIDQVPIHNLGLPFKGDFEMSQGFGSEPDDDYLAKKYKDFGVIGHDGVDFETPFGTQVLAADDGVIVRAREKYDYGTTIVIEHSWGKSYYGHLSELKIKEGDSVKRGEVIGLSGNTGLSTGPHLHFGVKLRENDFNNGYYGKISPLPYLQNSLIALNSSKEGNDSQVLGVSTIGKNKIEYKKIIWNVNVKKGDNITLSYRYKAPLISPQFYLSGPVRFLDKTGAVVFNEGRRWQIAADAVSNNGTFAYQDTADQGNLNARTYTDPTTLGAEFTSVTTSASNIDYVRMISNPTRDEKIAAHRKVSGRVDILKCTGGCDAQTDWSNIANYDSVNTTVRRPFDMAYEQLSGRLMFAFTIDNANDSILYCIYDGSSWTPANGCSGGTFTDNADNTVYNPALAGFMAYIQMEARGSQLTQYRNNEMLLAANDAGNLDLHVAHWTGSAWEDTATPVTDLHANNRKKVDIAWEETTGEGLVVFGDDTVANLRYVIYDGTSFGTVQTSGEANNGGQAFDLYMDIANDPMTDDIGIVTTDSGTDVEFFRWDGSTLTDDNAAPDELSTESHTGQHSQVAWTRFSSQATFIFTDANALQSDMVCWTSAGWSAIQNLISTQTSGDDIEDTFLVASGNNDRMLITQRAIDTATTTGDDIDAHTYDGAGCATTDWASVGQLTGAGEGTNIENTVDYVHSAAYTPYSPWSRNWRFFDDETVNDPSTGLNGAAENTTPTDVDQEEFIRLRINMAELSGMGQSDTRKKLQYTSGASCTPNTVEGDTDCTWTDVGDTSETTAVWRYATAAETCSACTDGNTSTTMRLTGSDDNVFYVSDKDAAADVDFDHTALKIKEIDFPLKAETVVASTTYYFRLYEPRISSNGQDSQVFREQDNDGANDCATATCTYPSLTISSGAASPTLDQLMRHGNWFSSGVEQPFTF